MQEVEVTIESVAKDLIGLGEKARYLLKEANLDLKKQRSFVDADNYRKELIQVASVAISALTDLEMQKALLKGDQESEITLQEIELGIWSDILEERSRQDELFKHDFPLGQDPLLWPIILLEEVAETVSEIEITEGEEK